MITLTEAASGYIKKKIIEQSGVGFRLTIKKKGCSGFSYASSIIHEIIAEDYLIETQDIKIFIDRKWLDLINGIRIDYVEEKKTGIKQKKLVYINPKETSRCGCGESFNVE